jgi:hypothetical protein
MKERLTGAVVMVLGVVLIVLSWNPLFFVDHTILGMITLI